jgi:hypothetical protein
LSRAQWRLKLGRAEHHFNELERHIRAYCDRHPYEVRRVHEPNLDPHIWSYRLHITEQPEANVALAMGDVVHNARAALDYLAHALAPKGRRTFFPIEKLDRWATDDTGELLVGNDEARKRFASAVRGIPADAVAVVHALQPYAADVPELHPLAFLSKLDNADKHRGIVPIVTAVGNVEIEIVQLDPRPVPLLMQRHPLCEDGTEVARFGFHQGVPVPPESDVQVQVRGAPVVAVDVGLKNRYAEVLEALRWILDRVPTEIFDSLEPFVLRR